jgi:hypothetical protein
MENKERSPNFDVSGNASTDTARDVVDKAKAKVSETLEEAQRQGKSRVGAQKDRAAEQAGKLSDALGQASARLRDEGEPSLARYTEQLASSISGLADRFRDRSVDDLLRDTRDLARREPALFLAGTVALGFAISRFFKASSSDRHDSYGDGEYGEEWSGRAGHSEAIPGDPEFGAPEPAYGGAQVGTPENVRQPDNPFSPGTVDRTDFDKKGV